MSENKIYSTAPDVSGKTWEEHFKTLFNEHEGEIEDIMPEIKTDINEELNKPLTMTEFQTIISKLKNNKDVGPDRIPNEFCKHVTSEIKVIILNLLNFNLKFGMTAETLCEDFITVIHKEGKRSNPDNYRGICIANSILEILSSLLEARLKVFCKKQNLINEAQIGFQENSRTSDHILTLKTIINKYVIDQKWKKIYACFIDFKKAFDSVWHTGLFRKLENLGINGNFLNLIKSIYKNTKCAVQVQGKTTNPFNYEKGVHQGNPSSPLLFNIFINDLFDKLKSTQDISLDTQTFNILMYADDLIILSTSKENLQKNLNLLNEYCNKWKLEINY